MNCPLCNGPNTFSVSKDNGTVIYYCFRAACHIAGRISGPRNMDDIKAIQSNTSIGSHGRQPAQDTPEWIMPWYFSSIALNEKAHEYLQKNNCLEAHYDRACTIMFDPRLNRVVFTIRRRSDGLCVDGAGRILKHVPGQPKWLRYNSSDYPFIVGNNSVAVIVEDCASACSVYAAGYTGVSLLGTNLKKTYISELKGFEECFICLDKDASKKSIDMYKALSPHVNVHIRFLQEDLKYCNKEQIKNIIGI